MNDLLAIAMSSFVSEAVVRDLRTLILDVPLVNIRQWGNRAVLFCTHTEEALMFLTRLDPKHVRFTAIGWSEHLLSLRERAKER